ncbi:MAG: hypothetical protein ACD_39C01693G0002 [uncultured bacterium]|nr:MAG: hypothetical protein ACD_39C01693G0002 [uncultured bacterium]
MKLIRSGLNMLQQRYDTAGLRFLMLFMSGVIFAGLQFLIPATSIKPSSAHHPAQEPAAMLARNLCVMRPTDMVGIEELDAILETRVKPFETNKSLIICALAGGRFSPAEKVFSIENQQIKPLFANGNGSFHHLSYYILRDLIEPMNASYSLILFDQHDDARSEIPDQKHPGIPLGVDCGNWLRHALERLPNLSRAAFIGRGYLDPQSAFWFSSILFDGRLDFITAVPIAFFSSIEPGPGWLSQTTRTRSDLFRWIFGANRSLVEFPGFSNYELLQLLQRLPTRKVYVSVDLDVLRFEDFHDKGWGSGDLSVKDIVTSIESIASHCEIIGADVTGYPPKNYMSGNYNPEKNRNSYISIFKALQKAMTEPGTPE